MLDGLGHVGVDVDQVVGANGELVPQHPLVEGQAEREVQLQSVRQTEALAEDIFQASKEEERLFPPYGRRAQEGEEEGEKSCKE